MSFSAPRTGREELDEAAAEARTRAALRPLAERELPLFVEGYLKRFHLTAKARQLLTDGRVLVFAGLADAWDEPGPPIVPLDDLSIGSTGRLARVLAEAFRQAARKGRLDEITDAVGDERRALLRALRIEGA